MRTRGVLLCSLGLALFACSCAVQVRSTRSEGPPPHAPAHGYRAKHTYRYYPSSYVYFDVGRSVYFYMAGGSWVVGTRLPEGVRVDVGEAVTLSLESDKPYVHFNAHKAAYPPGHGRGRSAAARAVAPGQVRKQER